MEQHKSLSFPATPCLLPGLLSNRREYTGILIQRIFVSILYLDTTVDFTHVVSGACLYWEQVSPRGNIYVLSRGYFPDTSREVLLQIRSETMSKRSVNHNLQKSAKNSKDILSHRSFGINMKHECTVFRNDWPYTVQSLAIWKMVDDPVYRPPHRLQVHLEGILPKGSYLPRVSMAGRALLAGYPRPALWASHAKLIKKETQRITYSKKVRESQLGSKAPYLMHFQVIWKVHRKLICIYL